VDFKLAITGMRPRIS